MKKRAITALIFVAVMLAGLYSSKQSFVALFGVITAVCLWEFFDMVFEDQDGLKRNTIRKWVGVTFGMMPYIMVAILHLNIFGFTVNQLFISSFAFLPLIFFCFIFELFSKSETPFHNVALILLGITYLSVPFSMLNLIAINGESFNPNIVLGMLLLTWSNDTGGYIVGSQLGKNKLMPRISPKKTWEGFAGGVVLAFFVSWLLSKYLQTDLQLKDWLVIAGLTSTFGTVGDLVESMLKRSFDTKDSGTLLPGHGGFLDRFDAFIFLIPFATTYVLWVRWASSGFMNP